MTETQLNKLRNRLLNIQTQLGGASVALAKESPKIDGKVKDALRIVRDVYGMLDTIKTEEQSKEEAKKYAKKRRELFYLTPPDPIISRNEPATYNKLCRHYRHIETKDGHIERSCDVGMDMCYCSIKGAYATNNVCSTKDDGRIGGKWR